MASIQLRSGVTRILFRHYDKQHSLPVGKIGKNEARHWKSRVEFWLMRLDQRLAEIPPGCSVVEFMRHDGNPPVDAELSVRKDTTLAQLREAYIATFSHGAIEANTLSTVKTHLAHVEETLGGKFILTGLTLTKLQAHINRRCPDVSPITAKKEIDSFRTAWNWGLRSKLVQGICPTAGLVYPKTTEKLPFMAWQEIERRIEAGGDAEELWECLFLDTTQLDELLKYVASRPAQPWVYPMIAMAAHTGARRSELMRAKSEDLDFNANVLTIREKKRARGKLTTRRVPLSQTIISIFKPYLAGRQRCPYLFGDTGQPLTRRAAQSVFGNLFADSKWSVVKGWHCLRHSFISACASKGIDQRLLDGWVGHQTEEQRVRYRHLYPSIQEAAINSVFGK